MTVDVPDLDSFLKLVTAQTRKHGRAKLEAVHRSRKLRLGFKSPEGEWTIRAEAINAAFAHTGLTKVQMKVLYKVALQDAIMAGERK